MAILNITTDVPGQVGVVPRVVSIDCTDTLEQIIQPGYINITSITGIIVGPKDEVHINYIGNQKGIFNPVFTNGVITLEASESSVITPTVTGNFSNFANTDGTLIDDGYHPSNPSLSNVSMVNGATAAGQVAIFSDTTGSIQNGGVLGTAANKTASDNAQTNVSSVITPTVSG